MRIIGKGGDASEAVVGHFRHDANRHAVALFDANVTRGVGRFGSYGSVLNLRTPSRLRVREHVGNFVHKPFARPKFRDLSFSEFYGVGIRVPPFPPAYDGKRLIVVLKLASNAPD